MCFSQIKNILKKYKYNKKQRKFKQVTKTQIAYKQLKNNKYDETKNDWLY